MDGTILNKKFKLDEKIGEVAADCEDLDDRVTALENAPAPAAGLNYYVENREPVAGTSWSHTFEHQPKVILLIAADTNLGANYYLATPICFKDDGTLAYTKAMLCNSSKQFNPISGLTYDKTTKTLSYSAGDYDTALNRDTNTIVYLSEEAPTPAVSKKKSKK